MKSNNEINVIGRFGDKWGRQWHPGNRVYDPNFICPALMADSSGYIAGNLILIIGREK